MKTLVTGGAGFIGSHLVDHLVKKGHEVVVLDDLSGGLRENVNSHAKFVEGSILDRKLVDSLMSGIDVVYHLAAYAAEGLSPFIRRFNYRNNLEGSINLINAAIKNKIHCFLFTSSMAVYGSGNPPFSEDDIPHPHDPYGISKLAVEMDLKCAHDLFGLDYVIVRPHNVYGERQFIGDPYRNVIGIFMNRIMQGLAPLVYGDGKQTRAFSYIGDVVPCIAEAPFIEKAKNKIINIGSSKVYTLNQLSKEVIKVMGSNLKHVHVSDRHEVKHAHCTNMKAIEILGFKEKTSLQEGLTRMAQWAKKVGPMEPIIWGGHEIDHKLPDFWKTLKEDYPNAKKRINIEL